MMHRLYFTEWDLFIRWDIIGKNSKPPEHEKFDGLNAFVKVKSIQTNGVAPPIHIIQAYFCSWDHRKVSN
jgi:hypothetical protein